MALFFFCLAGSSMLLCNAASKKKTNTSKEKTSITFISFLTVLSMK